MEFYEMIKFYQKLSHDTDKYNFDIPIELYI